MSGGGRYTAIMHLAHPLSLWRRARWLAPLVLACVCLAVLAPTLTRLLQSAAGVPVWQVVCGSRSAQHQSVRLMRVDAGGDASRAALHAAHDDCPLCGLQHQGWAPPPTFKVEVPQAESVAALPPLFLHAPGRLHAWAAPWSTGPPNRV